MSGLTDFQIEAARLFFGLSASDGFLLAGGGAPLASGLTDRPTHDLDFFGAPATSTSPQHEISSRRPSLTVVGDPHASTTAPPS